MVDQATLERLRKAREKKAPKEKRPLQKATKPIAGRSEKMKGIISALRPLYDRFIKDRTECEIKSPACTGQPECVHHVEGRGVKVILDDSKWKACCSACNSWVERKDKEATEKGHKASRLKKDNTTAPPLQ